MSKIWFCPNCGYEISSRGRCHSCRQKLVASQLPELEPGDEEDEVGYRLDDWADRDRGRLIERLNDAGIFHRFEDDELVVPAEDEERVDDLVADIAATAAGDEEDGYGAGVDEQPFEPAPGRDEEWVGSGVRLLADAAGRLRRDPTDMHADADVAEASTVVFTVGSYRGCDPEVWASVGRVTRRLLAALGAEEALEGEIRSQAAVLDKLLAPLLAGSRPAADSPEGAAGPETVYDLADWRPEQRAQLEIQLDESGIAYEWDGDDLAVPGRLEDEVEAIFGRFERGEAGADGDDGGEGRYRALEELFAASGRLASGPEDEQRAADVVMWAHQAQGPPPVGMDEVHWFRIMSRARSLTEAIGAGGDSSDVASQASELRDLLRTVV